VTRNGKIARLPYGIRDLLNRRLHNGEQGVKLMKWLNGLPKVQEVLAEEFGGRPISEQNLSGWKQGGFEDWLRHQETREWVQKLADESADLEEIAGDFSVADWLSAPLAVALGRWIHELTTGAQNDMKQRKALLAIAREVTELRRSDHTAERLRIDRERWDAEQQEKKNEELEKLKREVDAAEVYLRFLLAHVKHQYEEKVAAGTLSPEDEERFQAIFAIFAEFDRSHEGMTPRIAPFIGHQTGSRPIQPNQTNANKTQ
jgi:hypothetical protein